MPTQLRSYSKINLGLAIGAPRPDGFHGLATVYQTLELHDLVTVSAVKSAATSITLTTNDSRVPTNHHNTAWRMVTAALSRWEMHAQVRIHIEKRLPVQGGLGAGSANAAAALIALETELGSLVPKEALTAQVRLEMGAGIGSDVPLFLIGGTVLGGGRGEKVSALRDLTSTWCVVAVPAVGVSTPQAFRDWDTRHLSPETRHLSAISGQPGGAAMAGTGELPQLTSEQASDRLNELSRTLSAVFEADISSAPHSSGVSALSGDLAENPLLALVRTGIENDFEEVVFSLHPLLGTIKRILVGPLAPGHPRSREDRALYAGLSGSGSALFGMYGTEGAARKAYARVSSNGIAAFLTRTLPRDGYWREMLIGN